MIEEIFKKNNIKNTKQRNLVYSIVLNSNQEATLKYIYDNCANEVDIVTIYRIIDFFTTKGLFIKNLSYDGNIYYTLSNNKHEHYLNCIKCHTKEKIAFCPIEKAEIEIVKNNDFEIINHTIEFSGICHNCKKK